MAGPADRIIDPGGVNYPGLVRMTQKCKIFNTQLILRQEMQFLTPHGGVKV